MLLTPTMTATDVIELLGDTQDVGSGLFILCYRVDGAYTLNIPFATLNAQLGVTGEQLLQAKQPMKADPEQTGKCGGEAQNFIPANYIRPTIASPYVSVYHSVVDLL